AFLLGRTLHFPRDEQVALTVFASFKNLGLTVVLAFAVFGPVATLPSIVSFVCEILWLATLPFLFRRAAPIRSARGPSLASPRPTLAPRARRLVPCAPSCSRRDSGP